MDADKEIIDALNNLLLKGNLSKSTKKLATHIRDTLGRRPMSEILAAVPGRTVTEKAKLCEVSRQTWYTWTKGALPKKQQTKRLAEVTGYSIEEIRGPLFPSSHFNRYLKTENDRLRNIWNGMHYRCEKPHNISYKNYGGRGIKVCDRWKSFKLFKLDMGPCPEGYSIERIDNDGDYEPGNCKWIPLNEQYKNKRNLNKKNQRRKRLRRLLRLA